MAYKKIDLKHTGIAILPALAVSIIVILVGQGLGFSESAAERVSQILFFPIFLAVYNLKRQRSEGAQGSV